MSVVPFKAIPKDWDKEEQNTFVELYKFRIGRARRCQYITGLSEDKSPFFPLFVEKTGEVMMHICRGPNGLGYLVMGPSRKTTFALTTAELRSGYAKLDGEYLIKYYGQK
jgi:hypothetical protein